MCFGIMSPLSARSAIVLATLSILSYARALSPSFVIAFFTRFVRLAELTYLFTLHICILE